MTIETITRARATKLTGMTRLPYGMRYYYATGVQFYPRFGDWKLVIAGDNGLQVIVGKQKRAVRENARAA
jgi:hypothetical protein